MNSKIVALKQEIKNIENILSTRKMAASDKQVLADKIAYKKREIEKISKEEKKIIKIDNSPKVGNRKAAMKSSLVEGKFYL